MAYATHLRDAEPTIGEIVAKTGISRITNGLRRAFTPAAWRFEHEGYLAAVLLDGATTSSYSSTPPRPQPGSGSPAPSRCWTVAGCSCGWRGPEYLAVLHPPPADPLSGSAPPELDEAWHPAWNAHIHTVLAGEYARGQPGRISGTPA